MECIKSRERIRKLTLVKHFADLISDRNDQDQYTDNYATGLRGTEVCREGGPIRIWVQKEEFQSHSRQEQAMDKLCDRHLMERQG